MLFLLSNGDITKVKIIEDMEVQYVYDWFYILKVKELNELRQYTAMLDD